ncbi:MAG: amidohydrolase [Gemmatimonadota bacterium]
MPDSPWAEAVALRGDRVLAVGSEGDVEPYLRGATVRSLGGAFVAPGFIDNHTHFERAGQLLLGINLLDVADAAGLIARVRDARERLPEGSWIVGGDWGAYEAWEAGSAGAVEAASPDASVFAPDRTLIDSITPATATLLSRWDRSAYLANGRALELAGLICDADGVECADGSPTGRLSPDAAARVRAVIPKRPLEQRLAESRLALRRLASHGVTTIHDITGPNQLDVFQRLKERGELTVRVYARPTLDKWDELAAVGIRHGHGDDWVRIGGLKGFVDGIMGNSSARFYESYVTTGVRGDWRTMMSPPGNMQALIAGADTSGLWPQIHAIGDEAIDTLLDMYSAVRAASPRPKPQRVTVPGTNASIPEGDRWRVIHTQVIRGEGVARRMAEMGVIAEVQPYHAIDDMRWMEERIGERGRWAYAFRTLRDAGVLLSFGSDWPGTNASWYPASPIQGMYAAVTRKTLDGAPEGGWFPQESVDVETALRAYTVNNAWAAGQEGEKGTLEPGKLADVVVLDRSPFDVEPDGLKDLRVLLTIVGGRVVYEAGEEAT